MQGKIMIYDPNFDQLRLNLLAEQCLIDKNIGGQVIFSAETYDSHIDHATPQFNDDDYASLKKSGFMLFLIELLHSLSNYRTEHKRPNSKQGIVHVNQSQLSIEWLSLEAVEKLRSSKN